MRSRSGVLVGTTGGSVPGEPRRSSPDERARAAIDPSVIAPAYQAGSTLDDCLRSILDQRFGGTFEVVLALSADRADQRPPARWARSRLDPVSRPATR